MKFFVLVLLLCFCGWSLTMAQDLPPTAPGVTGTIKGTVQDSLKQEPLGYVTVILLETGKKEPIKTTLSRDNGSFELSGLPAKSYQLVLEILPKN
ncbi:carboxypeptidase regulatory-like domain-containing protein [Adhaeribacter pallidiroseus]|uniref:Carboxypeptidase regulatory-like domain-containing protein n=1 Tax=Adhaeribacter pallidiroseus TaxID=2072847 RepID=A0A369QW92_9BACT|nr:carboxypeptidase regulatory-like domain-containing protein [Adhaeribacter pallidiroseus]RDC66428.1 hypothetical protein AHMF7616_05059 [Adhaeribacter pallidiroseus]